MLVSIENPLLKFYFETPLKDIRGKQPHSREIITAFKRKCAVLMSIPEVEALPLFASLEFQKEKDGFSIRLDETNRLQCVLDAAGSVHLESIKSHG